MSVALSSERPCRGAGDAPGAADAPGFSPPGASGAVSGIPGATFGSGVTDGSCRWSPATTAMWHRPGPMRDTSASSRPGSVRIGPPRGQDHGETGAASSRAPRVPPGAEGGTAPGDGRGPAGRMRQLRSTRSRRTRRVPAGRVSHPRGRAEGVRPPRARRAAHTRGRHRFLSAPGLRGVRAVRHRVAITHDLGVTGAVKYGALWPGCPACRTRSDDVGKPQVSVNFVAIGTFGLREVVSTGITSPV